jgi:hypothetical protein
MRLDNFLYLVGKKKHNGKRLVQDFLGKESTGYENFFGPDHPNP